MRKVALLILFAFASCTKPPDSKGTAIDPCALATAQSSRVIKRKITAENPIFSVDDCVGRISNFNEHGNIVSKYAYSSCGVIFKKVMYAYNNNHRILSAVKSGIEDVKYTWKYNKDGQMVEKLATIPTTKFPYKLTFSYDSLGRLVESESTMADGSACEGISRQVFRYGNGLKTWTFCFSGPDFNEAGYRINHLYNEFGLEIKKLVFKGPLTQKADTIYIKYEFYN